MKLWKGATFAFMLCGAALSVLLTRNMAPVRQSKLRTKYPSMSSSSSSSSRGTPSVFPSTRASPALVPYSSSSALSSSKTASGEALDRRARSADSGHSLLSEFSRLFQSFTEGELRQVVSTLLDRKDRRSRRLEQNQARRTKRARRPKPCSLRELELTVSELGLGYESDETLLFRYCSGKCLDHRRNYDITLERMRRSGFSKKGRRDKVSNGPCCRPVAYEEDMSFLDNNSRYHTIQEVSAQACGCV
ncbi:neurturin isoform X2 [Gadus morhua]|nr:neurturin-like isoform X2 [Gadus morhua]